jgi:hypothetical protein
LTAPGNLYLALIHHPVYNKNGEVIASAVSNLDLHDISRAAKTYGVRAFYIVTPLADQRELAERILSHWTEGVGARYNPDRSEALRLIRVAVSLRAVRDEIAANGEGVPVTVVTDYQLSCLGRDVKRPASLPASFWHRVGTDPRVH